MRVRAKYAPGLCDYYGRFREVRWDLSGCNLRCSFCWSPASRPSETGDRARMITSKEIVAETLRVLGEKNRAFIRFTGGEPTLQWADLESTIMMLKATISPPRPPILIQTNGIEIGKGSVTLESLADDPDQYFLFELSFKGTNSDEFTLLTGKPPEIYRYQLSGYQRLLEFSRLHDNITVVAVLGVYHSSIKGPSKYAFVDPRSEKLLFDDYWNWDSIFSNIWQTAPQKWVESLRMSPKGVWENVLKRCGPNGAMILRNFPSGVPTNQKGRFPAKPKTAEYAQKIVLRKFWK